MRAKPTLSRAETPRYVRQHWRDVDPNSWVSAAVEGVLSQPVVLPLTRLSGSLVFPVLEKSQLEGTCEGTRPTLEIALVSVSPPARALKELLQLRAYGHTFVLLPPSYQPHFFDVAELDVRGIGVVAAIDDGSVERVVVAEGVPEGYVLEAWWRETREDQLRDLARA
ncbi:hypothetical protein [Pseudolysinimonas yzui]|uniref:Uncharacterized protein n=1 Tax=Pseudolysinimonas yzui TaxID=2708254 RepID=A0A8J3GSC0_9MICO|nr:hypothetical protein [Pseudolysinimonas yzui]GHF22508.1 hypothetical protein GCM10011600_24530 [Pseudolysinimonas yzui]